MTRVYLPLIHAALDQPNPTRAIRDALSRILEDPMLRHFMQQEEARCPIG